MSHLLLMPPFLWKEKIQSKKDLFFIVPISDAELDFANNIGVDRLIELLNIYDIDISDLNRESVNIPNLF